MFRRPLPLVRIADPKGAYDPQEIRTELTLRYDGFGSPGLEDVLLNRFFIATIAYQRMVGCSIGIVDHKQAREVIASLLLEVVDDSSTS